MYLENQAMNKGVNLVIKLSFIFKIKYIKYK